MCWQLQSDIRNAAWPPGVLDWPVILYRNETEIRMCIHVLHDTALYALIPIN